MDRERIIAKIRCKRNIRTTGFALSLGGWESHGHYVFRVTAVKYRMNNYKLVANDRFDNTKDARRFYYEAGMWIVHNDD